MALFQQINMTKEGPTSRLIHKTIIAKQWFYSIIWVF